MTAAPESAVATAHCPGTFAQSRSDASTSSPSR